MTGSHKSSRNLAVSSLVYVRRYKLIMKEEDAVRSLLCGVSAIILVAVEEGRYL